VEEVDSDDEFPAQILSPAKSLDKLEWLGLAQIKEKKFNEMLNFVVVIHKVKDIDSITKKSGHLKEKRDLIVCDDSNLSCLVTIWSDQYMEELGGKQGTVIGIQKARISSFCNGSLNVTEETTIFYEPEILPQCHRLRQWYTMVQFSKEPVDFEYISV
jgi:hypothetical protein